MKKQDGFIEGLVILIIVGLALSAFFVKWTLSEELVSGIVYDNTNNSAISGNTYFKVRAGVDTYVNTSNESSYCLPPNSPYIPLVKEAAADKSIKVTVSTAKRFQMSAPWVCMDNVTVTKSK